MKAVIDILYMKNKYDQGFFHIGKYTFFYSKNLFESEKYHIICRLKGDEILNVKNIFNVYSYCNNWIRKEKIKKLKNISSE